MLNPARDAAVRLLLGCDRKNLWTANAADRLPPELTDSRDRALAMNIFLGTVQNIRLIDYLLEKYSNRSPDRLDKGVRCILETGLYQLLCLQRVPQSAAVNEAVMLAKAYCPKAAGFVNAVLRKAARCLTEGLDMEPSVNSEAQRLALRYSCSESLAERLLEVYGEEFTEAFLKAGFELPGLTLRVNTLQISAAEYGRLLSEKAISYEAGRLSENTLLVSGSSVEELPGYNEGLFFVQDEAAALVSAVSDVRPGMKVLDCCSSPGGKSFSAWLAMKGEGSILSCDLNDKKTDTIFRGSQRLRFSGITCRTKNASVYDPELEAVFDVVICDVPCSGFGVIRKKPEIKLKELNELSGLPKVQLSILNNVSSYVKPGGTLVYSTCTVLPEENEDIIKAFLSENSEFYLSAFKVGQISAPNGMYTLWPHIDGTDGFFIACLKRN